MGEVKQNLYKTLISGFNAKELAYIAQLKRFFECYDGDPLFREALQKGGFSEEQLKWIKHIGISFSLCEVGLLLDKPHLREQYLKLINSVAQNRFVIPPGLAEALEGYPLLALWERFTAKRWSYKKVEYKQGLELKNRAFSAWRKRRIAAVNSELGIYGHHISHPILSLELAVGCSVQCWFCSFKADKLSKTLNYSRDGEYFRAISRNLIDIFGQEGAGKALPYHATEPYDTPGYLDFIKEYTKISGSAPCTSTAVTSNKQWVESLIGFYRPLLLPMPRLSVLSVAALKNIHENHSPEQLRDVELLMQMKESGIPKVAGGKIYGEQKDLRRRKKEEYLKSVIPQGSIECVSGFVINLVEKEIRLISPCYASKKWPLGYRIFDQASFDDEVDLSQVMVKMIEDNMPVDPPEAMPFKLRDDLIFTKEKSGFSLVSPFQAYRFINRPVFNALGEVLQKPPQAYGETAEILTEHFGQDLFETQTILRQLYDDGFLAEMPAR